MAVLLGALTACARPVDQPRPWQPVELLGTGRPVTVVAVGSELLVGTQDPTSAAPGLLHQGPTGWRTLPVHPGSGYGAEARWLSLAAGPDGLIALGGARGGAHGNVRWSVWRGSTATGLTEQPQPFETFGGWGAGDLVAAVVTPATPVLVGTWQSAAAGLDATVWLPAGPRWVRQDPTGTPLASSTTRLVGPRSATQRDRGVLVVGSVVLVGGEVQQQPQVWWTAAGTTAWQERALPSPGRRAEAVTAGCTPPPGAGRSVECLVLGWADGRLAGWLVDDSGARAVVGLPDLPLDERTTLPAPVAGRPGWVAVVPTDTGATAGPTGGPTETGSVLLRQTAAGWTTDAGPAGRPLALAAADGGLVLVTDTATGSGLWRQPDR